MRILLDTHLVLWWLNDDPALSAKARSLIADPSNTIFLSPVSHMGDLAQEEPGQARTAG